MFNSDFFISLFGGNEKLNRIGLQGSKTRGWKRFLPTKKTAARYSAIGIISVFLIKIVGNFADQTFDCESLSVPVEYLPICQYSMQAFYNMENSKEYNSVAYSSAIKFMDRFVGWYEYVESLSENEFELLPEKDKINILLQCQNNVKEIFGHLRNLQQSLPPSSYENQIQTKEGIDLLHEMIQEKMYDIRQKCEQ